ncbi:MAG: FAD-dependent oxidoreductase [Candidatus Eremiobacteraeota bacterium]|nr:FAD-dependent oxidoreductase [Candidatus Eremiobacteraeota bacterium]
MAAGRVAVVGAGLAGLAAALDLTDAGFAVDVFERSRLLGGRATSFVVDGVEVDNGQHVFLACCTELLGFIKRVGMANAIRMQPRFEAFVFSKDGRESRLRAAGLPAPWHLIASFVGYRHIRWSSKAKVAYALAKASDAARSSESFAGWLARTGQPDDALRAFWRPFFVPALNATLEEASAADAAFILSTAFLATPDAARFGYTSVPLARVAEAAADRVHAVHASGAVTGLELSPSGSRAVGLRTVAGLSEPFDAVILAVAPPHLVRLSGDPDVLHVPSLHAFTPHAIVDVHLWHDAGSIGVDFAALLDSPVQWIFEKGDGYVCCSLSAADAWAEASTQRIVDMCWSEASRSIPKLKSARLVRSAVTRQPEATYLLAPGVRRPGNETALPNVAVAGSWTDTGWPDTMESAVRSGRAAANLIVHALEAARVA